MTAFWLSFCDPDLPPGSQFLGCVITEAEDFVGAVQKAWRLGINPGGECAGGDLLDGHPYTQEDMDRLLSKSEAEVLARKRFSQ